MGKKRKGIATPVHLMTDYKNPKNYWILGIRLADEEPIILGKFKESDKPICCSLQVAEAIASSWSSLPDESGEEIKPMYQEVQVILAKSDGNGGWIDPKWCNVEDIKNVVRPGHFEAFGKESTTSRYTLIREKIYGCRGMEYKEDSQAS